jgi:hypothetical protein
MRVKDVRLKLPAQMDQGRKIPCKLKWAAFLTLAYFRPAYAMRIEKPIVMSSRAGKDDFVAFLRLSAGEIDGNINVPIAMLAMLDQMDNSHCLSLALAHAFIECRDRHASILR